MEVMAVFDRPIAQAAVAFVLHPWWPAIDVRTSLRRLTSSLFASADRKTGEYLVQSADRAHAYGHIPEPVPGDSAAEGAPPYNRATVEARVADYYASIRKPPVQWLSME